VRKHYDSANSAEPAERVRRKKVVWLTVNSTNANHAGIQDTGRSVVVDESRRRSPAATLLDSDGNVGKLYGARHDARTCTSRCAGQARSTSARSTHKRSRPIPGGPQGTSEEPRSAARPIAMAKMQRGVREAVERSPSTTP
jgi:hypothetical protein